MALPNHTMSAQQTLYTSNGNYVTESDESELVEVPKPTEFVYEGDSYWTEPEVFDTSEPEAIVNNTDTWFDERNTTLPIRKELVLPGEPTCRVAVEASHYLQLFIDHSPTNEPLLSALGGFPLALKLHIESNLAQWKAANLEPFFVFEGMSTIDREEKELKNAKEATVLTNKAWSLYTDNKATAAVTAFGRSAAIKAKKFVRFFQNILSEQGIEYLVAPYSACAQIAYLDSLSSDTKTQFIDAIMGSYELLLFKVDSVITKINFEDSTFNFISKKSLMDQLNTSEDTFVDALLCTGMYGIPPFPALTEGKTLPENEPGYSAKAAVLLIKSSGRTVGKMCETLVDKMTHPDWEAKYQKAKMAIKHNIVLHASGRVFVAEYDQLTADNAEYLGLQLPEELLYYLGKGAISPRILNWMGSLEMLVHPPLDGGESEEFKKLVSEQLVPIRAQTVALLASRLNRAYQHKNITMKFWYEGSKPVIMNPPNQITPKPSDVASSWCVKESQYKDVKNTAGAKPGSFTFALRSLTDSKFAASTTQKLPDAKLTTDDEISCNTIWRFLHLREYLNDKHELTVWGRALLAALEKAESAHNLEESVVLALELIRHDQLNTRNIYEDLIGGPLRGSDEEKADCLLISRVACLAKIQHKFIGYTGPLSRNLLTFHSLTTGVRECNRDLMETILVSILLNYEAERGPQRSYAVLSLRLPFWNDVDCALGIAVKTYLDDFAAPGQSLELKREKKSIYANQLIPHNLDFAADLDVAFQLFDAVYAAVQTLKDEVPDKSGWERANRYLTLRR